MMFIKFYLLKRLGGCKTTRTKIMNTSQIKQVVSSVQRKMGQSICLSAAHSVLNITNKYHGMIYLDSQADTTILGRNCTILTYTIKYCKFSLYSDKYKSI